MRMVLVHLINFFFYFVFSFVVALFLWCWRLSPEIACISNFKTLRQLCLLLIIFGFYACKQVLQNFDNYSICYLQLSSFLPSFLPLFSFFLFFFLVSPFLPPFICFLLPFMRGHLIVLPRLALYSWALAIPLPQPPKQLGLHRGTPLYLAYKHLYLITVLRSKCENWAFCYHILGSRPLLGKW